MAVSGQSNSVYVMKALMADLGRIKRANGYMTDVRVVKQPDYWPDDNEWKTLLAEETPAILVWINDESDPSQRGSIGEDRPELSIYLLGMVKQERGLQESLQGLASDVRRVMRQNPLRDHPDYAGTNEWGVNTRPSGSSTFNFMGKRIDPRTTAGIFESNWSIEYRFPRSTG